MREVNDWILLENSADLKKFEKYNYIYYSDEPESYPCYAQAQISTDECQMTCLLEIEDLKLMLKAVS